MSALVPVEFAENPENRCPVILLLDVSGSMDGEKIDALNNGLLQFKRELENDDQAILSVEIEVITFCSNVRIEQPFTTVDNWKPKKLITHGATSMGEAVYIAMDELEKRKEEYRNADIAYYRPWLIIMSDGEPTDLIWKDAAEKLVLYELDNKVSTYVVGIGDKFNDEKLSRFSAYEKVYELNGLEFSKLFSWLSASVKRVSTAAIGATIELPAVDWASNK